MPVQIKHEAPNFEHTKHSVFHLFGNFSAYFPTEKRQDNTIWNQVYYTRK